MPCVDIAIKKYFGELESITEEFVKSDRVAMLNNIKLGKKIIKLMDFYHFSRRGVNDMDYYYKPLSKMLKKIE